MFDPNSLDFKKASSYLPKVPAIRGSRIQFERDILALIEANDFWQEARRYVGPLPAPGDGFLAGMELLRKSFAPILKLREVLHRHRRGVIGREPQFEVVLPDIASKKERRNSESEGQTLADEADKLQGDVWDDRGEHDVWKAAAARLLATGSVYLRYDVPPGLIVTDGEEMGVEASDLTGAYEQIWMELCAPGAASLHLDRHTMKTTAFFSYLEEDEKGKKTKCIQISWVDKEKITQVRVLREKGVSDSWQVDTGGTPLVVEAHTPPLLTPDLLQLQDIVCSIGTQIKTNSDIAGHPEKTAIDVAPPTVEVAAPTPENPDAKKRVVAALPSGARQMPFLYSYIAKDETGKPIIGADGKPIVRQGSLHYREPVSSQPLRDDADYFIQEIYTAVNQRHIQERKSANASADMLVEMRADYADSLLETKPPLEKALRRTMHARLCMAAFLSGETEILEQFKKGRVRVDLNLNAGPLSKEEHDLILRRYESGLLSQQTTMVLLGTEDVAAELDQLKEEKRESLGDGH